MFIVEGKHHLFCVILFKPQTRDFKIFNIRQIINIIYMLITCI